MVKFFLEMLKINTPLLLESEIGTETTSTDRIIELSDKIDDKIYLSGTGGKSYMDMEKLENKNIQVVFQKFNHPEYKQEKTEFEAYLGVLDLLFNMGPESLEIIISGGE